MTQEPTRLVDDAAIPEGVRRHLRQASASPWVNVDAERGYARLCGTIATEAALTTAAASAGKSAWKLWALGGTGAAIGALAVGGALLGAPSRPPSPLPSSRPAAVASVDAASVDAASVDAASTARATGSEASAAAREGASGEAVSSPATAPAHASGRKAAPSAVALADEVAHLARARALAAGDPAAAFRLADEGHRSFSRGVLYPEREALAIDCLRRSGRRGEAQARAQRFVKRFPRSPFAERMRRENGLEATPG